MIDSSSSIELGDAVIEPSTEVYDVTLRGKYLREETKEKLFIPYSGDNYETIIRSYLMNEYNIKDIVSIDILNIDGDYVDVEIVNEKWFAIGDEHVVGENESPPEFNEEYFKSMLEDVNIDPTKIIEIQGCRIEHEVILSEKE